MKVKITATIANEYATRDVFREYWDAGSFEASGDTIKLMREDAEFHCDPYGPDIPHTLRKAYRAHMERLK